MDDKQKNPGETVTERTGIENMTWTEGSIPDKQKLKVTILTHQGLSEGPSVNIPQRRLKMDVKVEDPLWNTLDSLRNNVLFDFHA